MGMVFEQCQIRQYYLKDSGVFPNSPLPVLHYKKALKLPALFAAAFIKRLFASNKWRNAWRNGVLDYDHYHSTTHEALGFYRGKTTIQLGGKNGISINVEKGDVLIIPAGVAHRNTGEGASIRCVGAYPSGRDYDMNYGSKGERPKADENIKRVPLPLQDPVFGKKGGLRNYWKEEIWDLKKTC
jgi:uncharacterized protein YjlB